jgi:hypothetical protein
LNRGSSSAWVKKIYGHLNFHNYEIKKVILLCPSDHPKHFGSLPSKMKLHERLHEYPQPNLLNYNKFIGDIGAYIEPDLCLFYILYIIHYILYI